MKPKRKSGPRIKKKGNTDMVTDGRIGEDIALYVYAQNGVDFPIGRAYAAKDATVEFDNKTGSRNPVLIVQKGDMTIKMPVNRNVAYINNEPVRLNGLVLFNGKNAFVPKKAAELLSK